MANKVPHKKTTTILSTRSTSEKVMIVLGILISVSMVIGLFAGVF